MFWMTSFLVPLGLFTMIVLVLYFGISSKHSERVELIKRGINPEKYSIRLPGSMGLPIGVVFLAVGLGFFVPAIITGDWEESAEIGWSLAFLIAGIGLIVYWRMTSADRERALKIKEELLLREGPDFEPDRKPVEHSAPED